MKPRLLSIARLLYPVLVAGCAHELSSEERLERATRREVREGGSVDDVRGIRCDEAPRELEQARSANKTEAERLSGYAKLYSQLHTRHEQLESALNRNPDLAYQESGSAYVTARDLCNQHLVDVRAEFERYLRDIVEVPTVQEIKGGTTVTVPRMDFGVIRLAIESLNPDDKDYLLSRLSGAEGKIQSRPEPPRKKGK